MTRKMTHKKMALGVNLYDFVYKHSTESQHSKIPTSQITEMHTFNVKMNIFSISLHAII